MKSGELLRVWCYAGGELDVPATRRDMFHPISCGIVVMFLEHVGLDYCHVLCEGAVHFTATCFLEDLDA